MKFDILILSTEKDFCKLPYVLKSIKENIDGYDNIYIISPSKVTYDGDFINILDKDAIELTDETKNKWEEFKKSGNFTRHNHSWLWQQFIKLFQNVTQDNYLIVDSDIIINRKLDVICDNKPNFLLGTNQYTFEYFDYMKKMLNLEKIFHFSFINEIMFIDRNIIRDILKKFNNNHNDFIIKSVEIMNNDCFISEFEMYGNYTIKNFTQSYNVKYIKNKIIGKCELWSVEEIERVIEYYKRDMSLDIFSMHSWM